MEIIKTKVFDFWEESSCGEELYLNESSKSGYEAQSNERYRLKPYIINFADFNTAQNKQHYLLGCLLKTFVPFLMQRMLKKLFPVFGLFMLIDARK